MTTSIKVYIINKPPKSAAYFRFGDVSKWGRCRALPVADEAKATEWPRSKFLHGSVKKFRAPQQDITGSPFDKKLNIALILLREFNIYGDVSKWS